MDAVMMRHLSFTRRILLLCFCVLLGPPFVPAAAGKKLIFGGDRDLFPYEYLDARNEPRGYNIELIRAMARTQGWDYEIRLTDWPDVQKSLREGRIDAVMGMVYSKESERDFAFSQAHSNIELSFFLRKDAPPIFSLEDLRGRTIGLHEMGAFHEMHRALEGFRQIVYRDRDSLFEALTLGTVDVALCPRTIGLAWKGKHRKSGLISQDNFFFI